jgi:putative FmdB family regulatory protein
MTIYGYKCESGGHAKDVLQKMSDDPLTKCPACGGPTFNKQLTAAGFQLKGSGWYATDFKGGSSGTAAPAVAETSGGAASEAAPSTPSDTGGAKPAFESSASSASTACAASCACH